MNPRVRKLVVPALLVGAVVAAAAMFAVPEEQSTDGLSPEEIRRIDDFVERFRLGQRLLGSGRDADAETVFRDLLAEEPEAAAVHHALGTLLQFRGLADEATKSLLRAAELAPLDPVIQRDAGADLLRRGHPADAEPYLCRARKLWPTEVEILVLHATVLRALGRTDDARSAYREAVKLSPESVDARVGLAAVLVERKPEEALALVENLPHGFADVALVHGLALENLGRTVEAPDQFRTAYRRSPKDAAGAAIVAEAARALTRLGVVDDAVAASALWCELGGTPPALEPTLELAQGLVAGGRRAEALLAFRQARMGDASTQTVHRAFLAQATLRLRAGEAEPGRADLERLADSEAESPERAVARRALGRCDDDALADALGKAPERRNDAAFARYLAALLAADATAAEEAAREVGAASAPVGEFPALLVR